MPVSLIVTPLRDATGKIVGASTIAPDISRRREEEAVRALLERVLSCAGYPVLAASTPEQALQHAREGARPDAMISDTIMPGLTGPALAELVAEYVPALPTLFISGYTADVIRDRGQLPAGSAYLEKPFTPDALLEAVRTLLDPPRE